MITNEEQKRLSDDELEQVNGGGLDGRTEGFSVKTVCEHITAAIPILLMLSDYFTISERFKLQETLRGALRNLEDWRTRDKDIVSSKIQDVLKALKPLPEKDSNVQKVRDSLNQALKAM